MMPPSPSTLFVAILTLLSQVDCAVVTVQPEDFVSTATEPMLAVTIPQLGAVGVGTQTKEIRYCGFEGSTDAKFQEVPNLFGTNAGNTRTNNEGTLTTSFTIEETGYYRILARIFTPSSASNSMFIRLDQGDWVLWNQEITGSTPKEVAVTFQPSFSERVTEEDFHCFALTQGSHSFSLRWRELGSFVDYLTITNELPVIKYHGAIGCRSSELSYSLEDCPTDGQNRIEIHGTALCPDTRIEIGGQLCVLQGLQTSSPSRLAECTLPELTGSNHTITITSSGRSIVLPNVITFGAPVITAIGGCGVPHLVRAQPRGGEVLVCDPGQVLDIHGQNFGRTGARVLVFGQECVHLVHNATKPHHLLHCTLAKRGKSNNGIVVIQAIYSSDPTSLSAPESTLSSHVFSNIHIETKKHTTTYIIIGVCVGVVLLLGGPGMFYLFHFIHVHHAKRELVQSSGEVPWRHNHVLAADSEKILVKDIAVVPVFFKHTEDPHHVDRVSGRIYRSGVKSLTNSILGCAFAASHPPALVIRDDFGDSLTLALWEHSLRPHERVRKAVEYLADIARAVAFLHAEDVSAGVLHIDQIKVIQCPGNPDGVAILHPRTVATSLIKGTEVNQNKEVQAFGEICIQLLCPAAQDQLRLIRGKKSHGSNLTSARNLGTGRTVGSEGTVDSVESSLSLHGRGRTYHVKKIKHDLRFYSDVPDSLIELVQNCVTADLRPPFSMIAPFLEGVAREIVIANLVEQRTAELVAAHQRSDEILSQLIPPVFLPAVKNGEEIPARVYPKTSVFFSDIVGFTSISAKSEPAAVVSLIERMVHALDNLAAEYGVYRVSTIGDAYFAICGAPTADDKHAAKMVGFACAAIRAVNNIQVGNDGAKGLSIRVGIHSGPIAGGIQGGRVPRFDVFGDVVNVASRLESTGVPDCIHASGDFKGVLDLQAPNMYTFEPRGPVTLKGKGEMQTFVLKLPETRTVPELVTGEGQ